MAKEKKFSPQKAADEMLRELINEFGVNFMSDLTDLEYGNPLYVLLYEQNGLLGTSPVFPRRDIAETFLDLSRKYLPGFKNKKVKIYKLYKLKPL